MEQVEASTSNGKQDDSGSQVSSDDSEWEDSSSTAALCFQRVDPPPKLLACSSFLTDQLQQLNFPAAIAANVSTGGGEGIDREVEPIRESIKEERKKTGCSNRIFITVVQVALPIPGGLTVIGDDINCLMEMVCCVIRRQDCNLAYSTQALESVQWVHGITTN